MIALLVNGTAYAAEFSLKAVAINGVPIAPTSSPTVTPGDEVETEVYLAGWGDELPGGIGTYEFKLDMLSGYNSGQNGTVLPCGWDAPPAAFTPCESPDDCSPEYPVCGDSGCQGLDHDPTQCAFVNVQHPDFLFAGLQVIADVSTRAINYDYFGTLFESAIVTDDGTPTYCGTLRLSVASHACGIFSFGFVPESTFVAGTQVPPKAFPGLGQPLVLTVEPCVLLLGCDPGHCEIDARIPHNPNNVTERYNTRTIKLEFDSSAEAMTSADFQVTLVPDSGVLTSVSSVTADGNAATIELNRRIAARQWTCIYHIDSRRQCCVGSLPADVNWNRLSLESDVTRLKDNLLGDVEPTLRFEQCDTDRSGACLPADMLMAVDLLNGAQFFEPPYIESSLPVCPPQIP